MEHRRLGSTGVDVSCLALGGHEYYTDGRMKGFSDDLQEAVQPGYEHDGFGHQVRREILRTALESGVNYLDVTIDPEVRALRSNLKEIGAPSQLLVQMRPQGMCYGYDPGNSSLADHERLAQEVERLLRVSGRESIDVLNFGFEASALRADPTYLDKIAANISELKRSGMIRFAACDSLHSGEDQYLQMMRAGCFDVVWLTFSPLNPFPAENILPLAREVGMGVFAREAFAKGELFGIARATDASCGAGEVAGAALRWVLDHEAVSSVAVGVRNKGELETNLDAVSRPFGDEDREMLRRLGEDSRFIATRRRQETSFKEP